MTDGWVDCPSLGPGWKRREVLRKGGTRSGHSDTYYISPRGEKIRSRVELLRLLGCSRDLTDFDYRRGIFVEPNTEPLSSALFSPTEGSPQRVKKSSKKHLLHLAATTLPSKKRPCLQVFLEPQPSPGQGLLEQKPSEPELEFLGENQANMQSQQSALPVTQDQPAPKPGKRHQHPLPLIPSPGTIEDVTLQESNPKEAMACCASCQGQFPEIMLPSQRRCRWLCPDCRAQRRAFNREQRYYKKKISPKKDSCSSRKVIAETSAKNVFTPKQCGQKKPTLTSGGQFPKAQLAPGHPHRRQSATPKWKPTIQRDPEGNPLVRHTKKQLGVAKERKKVGRPPKHPVAKLKKSVHSSKNRQKRKCGECEACLLKTDCGRCDFCSDKPKFGGQNLKQQKCRWRQCLQFPMESSLISEWPEVPKSLGSEMPKQEKLHLQPQPQPPPPVKLKKETMSSASHQPTKECSVVPAYIQQEQAILHRPILPSAILGKDPDTKLPVINLLIATSPKNKQEYAEPGGNFQASSDSLVSARFPQFKKQSGTPSTEVVVLDDPEDDEMELLQQIQPPVIMEVYSLGGVQPLSQLDSVLREFLAELNEIPLPAHWEVLPLLGSPDLRLVQRSKHSTMSAAVIHIRPGLFFHVVVQDLLVPQEHKLYASHPARLTTVDEVVELICDLEAYQLCLGWPAGWHARQRSETCDILVHSGCCPQCRLNPWPSGSGTH
ncbi:PREDICTED: methyl-CpG-binding domain protein 1 isoform X5 [Thamnophis sirtalis]|uniref:Methyl-CpG-binding domain protein 1 isoform X5 n=1 Tax=Thamnophis sirtalis TaxID=35019 RepID=A0A6I9Y8D3_9SAUR|nr:PREDICTED: methyl-CpG-binding domain protein 1 isoform X5 [Thamnophis sirtalis]